MVEVAILQTHNLKNQGHPFHGESLHIVVDVVVKPFPEELYAEKNHLCGLVVFESVFKFRKHFLQEQGKVLTLIVGNTKLEASSDPYEAVQY